MFVLSFIKNLELLKNSNTANLLLGEFFYGLKEYKKSSIYYNKYLNQNIINSYVLLRVGNCNYYNSKYEDAIFFYENARLYDPDSFETISNLALSYYFMEKYEKCYDLFKLSLDIKKDNNEAYMMLGICSEKLGYIIKATRYYEKYLTINKNDIDCMYSLARCYLINKNFEKSIEIYRNIIELKPSFYQVWKNIADVQYQLQDYENAIFSYNFYLTIKYDDFCVWNNLANCYREIKDYDSAISSYKKALSIDESNYEVWEKLSFLHEITNQNDKSYNLKNISEKIKSSNYNLNTNEQKI
ncbi:MAG: tetratricopeptide repeat protein [Cyanobacteriota bacterium]